MKRKCQINAVYPITCFQVPIVGNTELNLTTEEIYKCLCAKAEVTEILSDGSMMSLDFSNYNKTSIIENTEKSNDTSLHPAEINVKEFKHVEEFTTEEDFNDVKEEIVDEEKLEDSTEDIEDNTQIVDEDKVESKETVEVKDENPVKTHEVHARNNNYPSKNKKNKNKR